MMLYADMGGVAERPTRRFYGLSALISLVAGMARQQQQRLATRKASLGGVRLLPHEQWPRD